MTVADIKKETIFLGPTEAICDHNIPDLCWKPYPGHKKGCPNYNKKAGCPTKVGYFLDTFDPQIYIIAIKFDFGAYLDMMRERHPEWTDKALRNVLYWQGHVRANLNNFIKSIELPDNYKILKTPEAMGMNMTDTCKQVGIELEWPPMHNTYAIVVGCKKKERTI